MRDRIDLDLPDRGEVEQRMREVLRRLNPECRLDELEFAHLTDIVTNHTLLLNDLYSERRIDRIMGQDPASVLHVIPEMARRDDEIPLEAIQQLRRIPDDVRVVGDKCLYDVGLFGRQSYQGLDLKQLGTRCYNLASEILGCLADDRRLREYFRQNRLGPMPIEEEVIFLRQCAVRFTLYSDLLKNLHLFDPVTLGSTKGSASAPTLAPPTDRSSSPMPALAPGIEQTGERRGGQDQISDVEIDVEGPEHRELLPLSSGVPGTEKLPRRDLVSLYERLVLFSNLDVPDLRDELNRVVIDQDGAVQALCDELSLYATGTQTLGRPASFFFVGPTGVGKNYLAECMVKALETRWGIEVPYLLLEGPQFTYPSDINELKGAARGFIRSEEEGILTEFYGRASGAPLSVILIDEVEKAHPQLRKFFLGVMDRGTTMDNRGDTLHFLNTIFIYTSNIGYSRLQTSTQPIGFGGEESKDDFKHREVVQDLKRVLTPEFVNRVSVIRFRPLSKASVDRIFDLEFSKVASRYRHVQGITLRLTPEAREEMIRQGYNPDYGARPLARLINAVCNVEVSKRLKEDDHRSEREIGDLLSYLREAREAKKPLDPGAVNRVIDQTRVHVPYTVLEVGWDGQAFTYTSHSRPS